VRFDDRMRIRISDQNENYEVILILPDKKRFSYVSISGESCAIHNIRTNTAETGIGSEEIPGI
ncbi:MAG: hypothetical protein K6F00_02780, partial [Lachnospiraceae bacterium]|nr:hypothetical protein [Lachnospiraceae bacterium]